MSRVRIPNSSRSFAAPGAVHLVLSATTPDIQGLDLVTMLDYGLLMTEDGYPDHGRDDPA
jgi:hypothetical protein